MDEINDSIAHITCNLCNKRWQVLNEGGTDWDEQATAALYNSEPHVCVTGRSNNG